MPRGSVLGCQALGARCRRAVVRRRRALRVGRGARDPPVRIRAAGEDAGNRRRRRAARRLTSGRSCSCGTPPWPSASISAAPHDLVHERLIAEPDLGLRRVHVDVERVGRHLDEQVHLRAALLDRRLAVGVDDRVRDRPVLHDAPVDEDVLRPARRPLLGQRGDVAGEPEPAGLLVHFDQIAAARRTAGTAGRAATPPAGTAAPCAPRSSA